MKKNILKICFLSFIFAIFFFNSKFVVAQNDNKLHIVITDEDANNYVRLDTVIPLQTNVNEFLVKKGYDIQKNFVNGINELKLGRKINIFTEVVKADFTIKPKPKLNDNSAVADNLPADAVTEELPDGSKRITYKKKDANGNLITETIEMKKPASKVVLGKEDNSPKVATSMAAMQKLLKTPVNKDREQFYDISFSNNKVPSIHVSIVGFDFFDSNTVNNIDPDLLNAKRLNITDFTVQLSFVEGNYRFKFNLAERGDTWFNVYDVVGLPVYTEFLYDYEGSYDKLLKPFNIFSKGTFLVVITQPGKKFTQKLIIQ